MADLVDAGPVPTLPDDDLARSLTVRAPGDPGARRLFLAGDTYTILISGAETGGRYCLIDMVVPDGGGPMPHRHDFEELFTLLEGELEFTFRGETRTIAAPASVAIPANAPHVFKNRSGHTVHMLCLCAPAGQDEFFEAIGDPIDGADAGALTGTASEAASDDKAALIRKLAPYYRTEFLD